ncbi:MAG: hypothetical protein ACYDBY_13995 [Thermoanaerobaculia bacterium]
MKDVTNSVDPNPDLNRDPITGAVGSHPVGTGLGSTGGAIGGALAGTAIAGPVGAVVGGVIGAIAGGAVGHVAGEALDPTVEAEYWSTNYKSRPYYRPEFKYEDYDPAYRYGWESASKSSYAGKRFDEIEPELASSWTSTGRPWPDIRDATRDAYDRASGRTAV